MSRSIYKKIAGALSVLLLPLVVYAVTQDKTAKFTEWVKIGGSANAHSTAALDINSITKGILIPRMTEAQRDAIQNPATGLQIYNTDTNKINIYNGAGWEIVSELTGSEITALLATKAPLDSPTFTGTITTPLTASRALQTNASSELEASSVTTTELGFLSGVTSSLCGIDQSCTLTNKTFTAPLINGGKIDLGTASSSNLLLISKDTLTNLNANVTPTQAALAFDTTNNRPVYGTGTEWKPIGSGSGSGSGGINYAENYFAGDTVDGITCSDANLTVSHYTSTSDPKKLRELGNIRISKAAADVSGAFCLIPLKNLDEGDRSGQKALYVRLLVRTSSAYQSGDVRFSIIDDDSEIPIHFSEDGSGNILATNGEARVFTGYFFPESTTESMNLAVTVQSTNASAYEIDIADLVVSPQGTAPGAIQTEWQSFTPTLNSLTSVSTRLGAWRRVGDTMEIQALIAYSGVGDASDFSMTIPNGEAIDPVKFNVQSSGTRLYLGTVTWVDSGTAWKSGSVRLTSPTSVGLVMDDANSSFATNLTGNGDTLSLWFKVPIKGWAATQTVGTNEFLHQNPAKTPTKVTSSEKTPSASGHYHQLTDNALVLTRARTYELSGTAHFYNSGPTPGYGTVAAGWYGSNGADSTSPPTTALSSVVQIESAVVDGLSTRVDMSSGSNAVLQLPTVKVKCSSPPCTVYLVTYASMNTAVNSRIKVYANASEIPDFSAWTVVPLIPPGTVTAYAGTNVPDGWLLCDGRAVSRTQYAALFAAIGTAHGHGDGSTTFNLPDYRGRFLRGVKGTSHLDPDADSRSAMNTGGNTGNNVGSVQGDAFRTHNHNWLVNNSVAGIVNATSTNHLGRNSAGAGSLFQNSGSNLANIVSIGFAGGNETRPVNAYVNYIIKY